MTFNDSFLFIAKRSNWSTTLDLTRSYPSEMAYPDVQVYQRRRPLATGDLVDIDWRTEECSDTRGKLSWSRRVGYLCHYCRR